jgi:hypothetical protein
VKIGIALREAHAAETALASELERVGRRHESDHDVFHVTRTLLVWCGRHRDALAAQAARYELQLEGDEAAGAGEEDPEPEALLHDLRELHLAAARASLAWTALGQGAQAISDEALLATVDACHPETIRTMKWTVQKVKEASPQILAAG